MMQTYEHFVSYMNNLLLPLHVKQYLFEKF